MLLYLPFRFEGNSNLDFDHRRRLIEAIDDYKGDDPLLPWLESVSYRVTLFPAFKKFEIKI